MVRQDNIDIPDELMRTDDPLTLCMDVMYVNGAPMLTAIDKTVKYRSLVALRSRTADSLYSALDKMLRNYNDGGFTITDIQCDQEFETLMEEVSDQMDINMDYPPAGAHVPAAERNNRVIGERIRAAYHRLPFKAVEICCTTQTFQIQSGV